MKGQLYTRHPVYSDCYHKSGGCQYSFYPSCCDQRVSRVLRVGTVAGHVTIKFVMIQDIDLINIRISCCSQWTCSYLLPHANVSLSYENTSMVDRLGHVELPDLCLETALEELLRVQLKDILELLFVVV